MNKALVLLALALAACSSPLGAQTAEGAPQFQVDALWPKPLPNKWILGQVSGIYVDRHDRV